MIVALFSRTGLMLRDLPTPAPPIWVVPVPVPWSPHSSLTPRSKPQYTSRIFHQLDERSYEEA